MNNHRLLSGLLLSVLTGGGMCVCGQTLRVVTLEEVFESAESNSVQLRPAYSSEEVSAQELREARSRRLPDINISLSVGYNGNGFTTKRDFSDYQTAHIPHLNNGLAVGITQPVYSGGAITAGIELGELKRTASGYATDLARDNVRFQLAGFYLDLYRYSNMRRVVEKNIAQARKVLDEMHIRHEQGVVLQNDITRYELLVSNLELQLVKIDNTLTVLNDNLVTIAGLPRGTTVIPDSTILNRTLPTRSESTWQEETTTHSPLIRLAESKVDISRKTERIARSELLPKVGLQAGWSIDGPILTEVPPINRNLSYWYAGVGVTYNLSSLYKGNKTLARSRAATANAADEYAAARENTELAIRADYIRYLEAYEELKTQEKSVELAERNYDIVLTRYTADMALITDMLDAANSKLDAEQQLVNARIQIIYNYYKLLHTSGKI